MRVLAVLLVWGGAVACTGRTESQRSCEDYARTFADVAANTCRRGTFDANVAAFKTSARVGEQCELVGSIRDQAELEGACYDWLRQELPQNCSLLDSPEAFVAALPDACRGQLQVQGGE